MVKALVLANSYVGLTPPPPEAAEQRRLTLELLNKGDMKRFAETMATDAFSPGFKYRKPSEFENYIKVKLQNEPDGLAQVMPLLGVPTSPLDLGKLKCPVRLIVGNKMQGEKSRIVDQRGRGRCRRVLARDN